MATDGAPPLCPTAAHSMVISRCEFTCNSCRHAHEDGDGDHWACAACGDDFCFECRPPVTETEAPGAARKRRWAERFESARSMLTMVGSNARPVSSRVAAVAKRSGELAGGAIKTGGIITGAAVAGLGVMAFGGVAGAALVAGGGMAAAAGCVGCASPLSCVLFFAWGIAPHEFDMVWGAAMNCFAAMSEVPLWKRLEMARRMASCCLGPSRKNH